MTTPAPMTQPAPAAPSAPQENKEEAK